MLVSGRDPQIPHELDEGYAATFERMRRMFRARGLEPEEAADLAQESIARALLHIKRNGCDMTFDGVAPLLKRIATNLLIDRARAVRLRVVSIDEAGEENLPSMTDGADQRVDQEELHAVIRTLSTRHQRVVRLSLDGHTPAEIASYLGIERNAADALLHRARRRLAEKLRHAGHAMRVMIFVWLMRGKLGVRRTFGGNGSSATPAMMNVAAAAIAVAIAFGGTAPGVSGNGAGGAAARMEAVEQVAAQAPRGSDARVADAAGAGVDDGARRPWVKADVDADDHRVRVESRTPRNPATGEEESLITEVWHEREEQDRGVTGPLLDEATRDTCGLTATCR